SKDYDLTPSEGEVQNREVLAKGMNTGGATWTLEISYVCGEPRFRARVYHLGLDVDAYTTTTSTNWINFFPTMVAQLGINGFGRIGRLVFRAAMENPEVKVVAVNDPFMNLPYMQYLLKYDSVHGRFNGTVEVGENALIVNGQTIQVFAERNPCDIP
ncbi:hypothetical protein FOZ63_008238, partial [Perkinsus olseni]